MQKYFTSRNKQDDQKLQELLDKGWKVVKMKIASERDVFILEKDLVDNAVAKSDFLLAKEYIAHSGYDPLDDHEELFADAFHWLKNQLAVENPKEQPKRTCMDCNKQVCCENGDFPFDHYCTEHIHGHI